MNANSILAAQEILIDRPFDAYHDIFHHYKVWENSRTITFIEKLEADTASLDIACWWHDIFKGENDTTALAKTLSETDIDKGTLDKAVAIISQHSFGEQQTLLESKILYDADKIEYISLARWQAAFEAYDKGFISLEEKERYVAAWNQRVPGLRGKLHFTYSNEVYAQQFALFTEWIESIGRYKNGVFV